MKQISQITIIGSLIFSLLGCATSGAFLTDISGCNVFDGLIQKEMKIERECAVIQQKGLSYFHMVELNDEFLEKAIIQSKREPDKYKILYLDQKDRVVIEKVNIEKIYAGPTFVVAHGEVIKSENGKRFRFEYFWSDMHLIPRAPWDNESVDELRLLKIDDDYMCK